MDSIDFGGQSYKVKVTTNKYFKNLVKTIER